MRQDHRRTLWNASHLSSALREHRSARIGRDPGIPRALPRVPLPRHAVCEARPAIGCGILRGDDGWGPAQRPSLCGLREGVVGSAHHGARLSRHHQRDCTVPVRTRASPGEGRFRASRCVRAARVSALSSFPVSTRALQHAGNRHGQMWSDTLFMAGVFLARWGVFCDNDIYLHEAVRQPRLHYRYLLDPETGLMFHAYDCRPAPISRVFAGGSSRACSCSSSCHMVLWGRRGEGELREPPPLDCRVAGAGWVVPYGARRSRHLRRVDRSGCLCLHGATREENGHRDRAAH